jgi:hypothetical protein
VEPFATNRSTACSRGDGERVGGSVESVAGETPGAIVAKQLLARFP